MSEIAALRVTPHERVEEFAALNVLAFTTTRAAGTFGLAGTDPVGEIMGRWTALLDDLSGDARGIVVAPQIHGTTVLRHGSAIDGLLRTRPADGHVTQERGLALAVTIADCIPIFIAHPSGAVAVLHSGWKGTAGKIIHEGIRLFGRAGLPPDELYVHLGPGICGRCYEVSADVRSTLTGEEANRPGQVDLRALILDDARAAGVRQLSASHSCTRCDADRFFSHRGGDSGRQIAVIVV